VVSNMILHDSILGDSVHLVGTKRKMNIGDHSLIEMEG
jgi:glucose-1-phosphate thymidylyltransferase